MDWAEGLRGFTLGNVHRGAEGLILDQFVVWSLESVVVVSVNTGTYRSIVLPLEERRL